MKAVMLSIQPKWCLLIASSEKTIEVRKTRPKIDTPFKVYIYCTKAKVDGEILWTGNKQIIGKMSDCSNEKVIGEFICDEITELAPLNHSPEDVEKCAYLTREEIVTYLKGDGYAWHISNLVIYDKPKELREFKKICRYRNDDGSCQYKKVECGCLKFDFNQDGSINLAECVDHLSRPPQSWMYVEEVEE